MGRHRGKVLALLAVLCAAAVIVAAPAGGAAKAKVTVGIGYNAGSPDPFFRGRVRSSRPACLQNRHWQRAGLGQLRIAVNLSARQFSEPDLVRTVRQVLDDTGLAPDSLEIELTESMMMADVESAIETMRCLKAMGVKLSIDDFGTGYSSLAYLKRFPVDVLKIDRSFVRDIVGNRDGAAMVDAIISLAHSLRMHVIAEGVETVEQLDYLRGCGCDEVQGHVYARPEPVEAVEALLRRGRVDPLPVHA